MTRVLVRPWGAPLSSWLLVAAGGTVAVTAVGLLGGLVHAEGSIADLRAATRTNAATARQLGAGLAEANRRLRAAGEAPVPVPAVSIVAGPAGASGAAGAAGPVGPAGVQGAAGAPGVAGAPGSVGPAGPDGAAGSDGQPGGVGPAGAQGVQGPQGDPGPAGAQGPAGADGTNGTDGTDGSDGADGQPPTRWTFTIGETTYTCARTDQFDPTAPTYTCPLKDTDGGPR